MHNLELELKQLIVDSLNLEDIDANDIDSNEVLFGEGLGLDSIDALELGVAVQKKYGVKFNPETENITFHFSNVTNLAAFIVSERDRLNHAQS